MSEVRPLPEEKPTLLSFRGPDAVRYLNGQITQSTADLGDKALPACVTDAKGRLQFFVHVMQGREKDELWVFCPAAQGSGLADRLERYLIADDVELTDFSGQWSLIHADERLEGAPLIRERDGIFSAGFDHWWPKGDAPSLPTISDDEAEFLRVSRGIPAWGTELVEGMLPPEAGLDRSAISYSKGCYIGQEVLSRIKSAGKVNRRLARFTVDQPVDPTTAILLDGTVVGELTSVARAQTSDAPAVALGYLKKSAFEATAFQTPEGATALFVDWA